MSRPTRQALAQEAADRLRGFQPGDRVRVVDAGGYALDMLNRVGKVHAVGPLGAAVEVVVKGQAYRQLFGGRGWPAEGDPHKYLRRVRTKGER